MNLCGHFYDGGDIMKITDQLNIKVDDRLLAVINTANNLVCTLFEFIQTCIELGSPLIMAHPDLLGLLPFQSSNTIKQ
jgi:hypothetical protein